jgi:hypothetical protein
METLRSIELQSTLQWMNAIYIDNSGQEYEVVFTKYFGENIGCENREVVNVEKDDTSVKYEEPIWIEIQEAVNNWKDENVKFTVEIDREWLDTLESLTEWVLNSSKASPEEALEISIFRQFKAQLAQFQGR